MLKLTAILTGFCLALTVSAQAAKPEAPKEKAQKPKAAQKQQAPKQQAAPKTQVQAPAKTERSSKTTHSDVPKKQERSASAVESSKPPTVKSKEIQADKKQLQTQTTDLQPKKSKLDKQTVQRIQAQHLNFKATPKTAIASVKFNPNYRIEAAQNWSGPQYEVFRSYQPQWHDQTWYRSRYSNNLSLIGGGWYFWNDGYWFPAWGYDDAAAYYPYDGPIYVGPRSRPFDQVVADVQAVLQEQGYYRGDVDGLVGPLTREALTAYQSAQGLPPTAAIDQPTLESLGLS